jgi:hypothetical protein
VKYAEAVKRKTTRRDDLDIFIAQREASHPGFAQAVKRAEQARRKRRLPAA